MTTAMLFKSKVTYTPYGEPAPYTNYDDVREEMEERARRGEQAELRAELADIERELKQLDGRPEHHLKKTREVVAFFLQVYGSELDSEQVEEHTSYVVHGRHSQAFDEAARKAKSIRDDTSEKEVKRIVAQGDIQELNRFLHVLQNVRDVVGSLKTRRSCISYALRQSAMGAYKTEDNVDERQLDTSAEDDELRRILTEQSKTRRMEWVGEALFEGMPGATWEERHAEMKKVCERLGVSLKYTEARSLETVYNKHVRESQQTPQ